MSKINDILAAAKRTAHKVGLKVKKYSPEILVVAGIAGVITSTVMACKATVKATSIIEEHNKQMNDIHTVSNENEHKHEIKEPIHDKLKVDDQVVLLKINDKFIIISKVVKI